MWDRQSPTGVLEAKQGAKGNASPAVPPHYASVSCVSDLAWGGGERGLPFPCTTPPHALPAPRTHLSSICRPRSLWTRPPWPTTHPVTSRVRAGFSPPHPSTCPASVLITASPPRCSLSPGPPAPPHRRALVSGDSRLYAGRSRGPFQFPHFPGGWESTPAATPSFQHILLLASPCSPLLLLLPYCPSPDRTAARLWRGPVSSQVPRWGWGYRGVWNTRP